MTTYSVPVNGTTFPALVAAEPDLEELTTQISADPGIVNGFDGLNYDDGGPTITALFTGTHTPAEETIIDGYYAAHTGLAPLAEGGTSPHGAVLPAPPDPLVNDATQGFTKGSIVVDDSVPEAWINLRDTPGSTIWQRVGDASEITATEPGQILISIDGAVFTQHTPVTSCNGWLVNADGCLLVTE